MENLIHNEERILVVYTAYDRIDHQSFRNNYKYKLSKRYHMRDFFALNDGNDLNDVNSVYSKLRQEICDFSPTILLLYADIASQIHPRIFAKILSKLSAEFTHLKFHYARNELTHEMSSNEQLADVPY